MNFPWIEHIDDVKHVVAALDEFKMSDHGTHVTIDYQVQTENTFRHPIARECRGIKFWPDGKIAFRPFHKFFNRGERVDLEEAYYNDNYRMFEKLDGSLIHFMKVNGEVRAMTKAGITDVSILCESELDKMVDNREHFLRMVDYYLEVHGVCLMFEYTSPRNRIVIKYDRPQLTLIGARNLYDGEYQRLEPHYTEHLGVERVKEYTGSINDAKDWVNREGLVLVWGNGYRLKLKADDYVLKHRTKDAMQFEKNVIELSLSDAVDDMAGALDHDDFVKLREYADNVIQDVKSYASFITTVAQEAKAEYETRKEQAAFILDIVKKSRTGLVFKVLDGHDPVELVTDYVISNCGSQTKVDNMRDIIQTTWNY